MRSAFLPHTEEAEPAVGFTTTHGLRSLLEGFPVLRSLSFHTRGRPSFDNYLVAHLLYSVNKSTVFIDPPSNARPQHLLQKQAVLIS